MSDEGDWCSVQIDGVGRLCDIAELDMRGADHVEVQISPDGETLWINDARGCRVRICKIRGGVSVVDMRIGETKNAV